jgi:hypothetical protein
MGEETVERSFLKFLNTMWENWQKKDRFVSFSDNQKYAEEYTKVETEAIKQLCSIEDTNDSIIIGTLTFFNNLANTCVDHANDANASDAEKFGYYLGEAVCRYYAAGCGTILSTMLLPICAFLGAIINEVSNEWKALDNQPEKVPKKILKLCKAFSVGVVKGVGKATVALGHVAITGGINIINLPLTILGRPLSLIVRAFKKRYNEKKKESSTNKTPV